jgi:hypothetical protein
MLSAGGGQAVFAGAVNESEGLRLLVASLWATILIASICGLFFPRFFAPILLIQIVYKALWLGVFCLPLILTTGTKMPSGVAICFAMIVATYPFLFWVGYVKGSA